MAEAATKSIVVESVIPHAPEKIWRALTQAPMIAEWLMKNDFKAVVGHKFRFHATPKPGWKGYTPTAKCLKSMSQGARLLVGRWHGVGQRPQDHRHLDPHNCGRWNARAYGAVRL